MCWRTGRAARVPLDFLSISPGRWHCHLTASSTYLATNEDTQMPRRHLPSVLLCLRRRVASRILDPDSTNYRSCKKRVKNEQATCLFSSIELLDYVSRSRHRPNGLPVRQEMKGGREAKNLGSVVLTLSFSSGVGTVHFINKYEALFLASMLFVKYHSTCCDKYRRSDIKAATAVQFPAFPEIAVFGTLRTLNSWNYILQHYAAGCEHCSVK